MIRHASKQKTVYISVFLIVAVLLSIVGCFTYLEIKNVAILSLGKSAEKVAITAADFIEADIDSYQVLAQTGDYASGNYEQEYYQKMNELFHNIQAETGVSYIYTTKKLSDTEAVYILDGEDPKSKFFSPIGSVDELEEAGRNVYSTGIAESTNLTVSEKWGTYLTGYAPIKDPQTGEVCSVVGVDFSSASIMKLMEKIELVLVIAVFSLIVLTSFIIFKLIGDKFAAENVDYLTALHSKRYHDYQLSDLIAKARNSESTLFLMMIDIDFFKEINDEYGHDVGDQVLRHIADIIKTSARKKDVCSRFGGDEFVLILSDANEEQVGSIAARIMEKLRKSPLVLEDCVLEGTEVTLSIGIAQWKNEMCNQNLTQYADEALYFSKQKGRNQITFHKMLGKMA